ncbi:MAG: hypothetical protein J7474_00330 [Arthrobacter sp.]|nr:hypothetical protein [Arthrobacter sp.]
MTENAATSENYPDAIGFGFAEMATLVSMREGAASTASAEALRITDYVQNPELVTAGASSLVARGLATVDPDGGLSIAGPTAAVAATLSSATRRMEISLLTAETADSVLGFESAEFHILFQPRAYFTWWAMAQRPDISGAEADLFIIKEHLRVHPKGGATILRREDPSGKTLYIKTAGDSWTVGVSTPAQNDISETSGLDDAALLEQIRLIRED